MANKNQNKIILILVIVAVAFIVLFTDVGKNLNIFSTVNQDSAEVESQYVSNRDKMLECWDTGGVWDNNRCDYKYSQAED